MNRPERRNAFNRVMVTELRDVFQSLAADRECRAVVLTGAGGAFCSGADLSPDSSALPSSGAGFLERMHDTHSLVSTIAEHPDPVIAAVEGVAAGGGCNLALVCDIVLASKSARFFEIFVKRGLTVDMGGSWALVNRIGLHRAKEMAFTGDEVSAQEAERIGLINRVCDDVQAEAAALASRIAANAPLGVRLSKDNLNRASNMTLRDSLEAEARAQALCFGSKDVQEGVAAFLEKREPRFNDD